MILRNIFKKNIAPIVAAPVRTRTLAVNAIRVAVVTNWIIVYLRRIKRRDDDKNIIINLFRWVGQKSATPFNLSTTLALHSACLLRCPPADSRRHMLNQLGTANIGQRKAYELIRGQREIELCKIYLSFVQLLPATAQSLMVSSSAHSTDSTGTQNTWLCVVPIRPPAFLFHSVSTYYSHYMFFIFKSTCDFIWMFLMTISVCWLARFVFLSFGDSCVP